MEDTIRRAETKEMEKFSILRLTEGSSSIIEDTIAKESPLTIILNNQELVTLLCSPANLEYLAVGFLFSEGLLKHKGEIKKVAVDDRRGVVRVEVEGGDLERDVLFKRLITSGCGRGASFYSAADVQNQTKNETRIGISAPPI